MLRLLLTKRWLGYLSLTIAFAVVSSMFGMWQWDRRGQAVAAMEKVESHFDRTPVPLEDLLSAQPSLDTGDEWIPVIVKGHYLGEEMVLVRTRPRSGAVGFEILVPFVTDDLAVIVNRGWIPTGETRDFPDSVPQTPEGQVSLVARVKPTEPLLAGRGAPEGQIASIHLPTLQTMTTPVVREDFFLVLGAEEPSVTPSPLPQERPQLDEGPHLSYTFQWYLFALMAFGGLWYMLRQDIRLSRGEDIGRRKNRDDQEEDALLEDSQG